MIIDENKREIKIKIVYFGPAMSGKTTSLKELIKKLNINTRINSIETTTGRTLVFDFGMITIKTENQWNLNIYLYSATGQDFYAGTRATTLMNVDGIIFVMDSQREFFKDNLRSARELKMYLGEKIGNIPIIICPNKQDLPNTITDKDINTFLEELGSREIPVIPTVAKNGIGILESFNKLLCKIISIENPILSR